MSRLIVISISLLCAVLSGTVAKMSYESAKTKSTGEPVEEVKVEIEAETVACSDLLKEQPLEAQNLRLTNYKIGKKFASRDVDQDKSWDLVAAPLFSSKLRSLKNNYSAAIVIFDNVTNRDDLHKLLETKDLQVHFIPADNLPEDMYSKLARKYERMDFKRSVVLHGGFAKPASSPLQVNVELGKTTMLASLVVCGLSILCMMVNLLTWVLSRRQKKADAAFATETISNRAGLPLKSEDADGADRVDDEESALPDPTSDKPESITELLQRSTQA